VSGTRAGGLRAAEKNLKKDPNFYKKIGAIGGANGKTGGFAARTHCACEAFNWQPHITAQCIGKRGGRVSKRKSKKEN